MAPQTPAAASKKRKSLPENSQPVASGSRPRRNVQVEIAKSTSAGPIFANFPSIRPAKDLPFTIYSREPTSNADLAKQLTTLAGETEDISYFSVNRRLPGGGEAADVQYLPAVYDTASGTLTVHPSAPLYLLSHSVKRLASVQMPSLQQQQADYRARRNDLGEAFGTRKRKTAIRAEERNKVDVSAMQGVKGQLMDQIGEKEAKPVGPEKPSELIPVPNTETSDVDQVYPLESLLSQSEWSSIDVGPMARGDDLKTLLPGHKSSFTYGKVREILQKQWSGNTKQGLRACFFLASLLQFWKLSGAMHKLSPKEMAEKMDRVPAVLREAMLSRFTERSGKSRSVTDRSKTKLLAWICVTYLFLDGWSVKIATVCEDLGMTPAKITDMFKSLGCSTILASTTQREKLQMSLQQAKEARRATLKAPVQFPKPRRAAPAKR